MNRSPIVALLLAFAASGFGQAVVVTAEVDAALFKAIGAKDLKAVGECLARGANPNAMDKMKLYPDSGSPEQDTALSLAVRGRSIDIVKLLLSKGADVNIPVRILFTTIVSYRLVDSKGEELSGSDVSHTPYDGYSPLMLAVKNGDADIVALLLQRGADAKYRGQPNYENPFSLVDGMKDSALPLAIAEDKNTLKIVGLLLSSGAEVDIRDEKDATPLMTASSKGDQALAELLIKNKADVNAKSAKNGSTPLSAAISGHFLALAGALIKHGADIEERDYLSAAARNRDAALADFLLKNGAKVDGVNPGEGNATPLMLASSNGDLSIAKLLVENAANVNAKDKRDGSTPLSLAIRSRNFAIADLLLQNGADIRERDFIRTEAEQRDIPAIDWLLKNGIDVDSANTGSGVATPLMIASGAGDLEMVEYLVGRKANVNARNQIDGSTPLVLAIRKGHTAVAQFLLERGASTDKSWKFPVDARNTAMIKLLKKYRIKYELTNAISSDRKSWLLFDTMIAPLRTSAEGAYFSGFESGYGFGIKARALAGGIVGVLSGLSYERTTNAYLGSAYEIGLSNFSLDLGVFLRDKKNIVQVYGLVATTGTAFTNGPPSGKLSEDEDAGGELSLEAGLRVKIMGDLGIALFIKNASYAYSPGYNEEDGSVTTIGAGISYQF
jgi:uncharacterized protein